MRVAAFGFETLGTRISDNLSLGSGSGYSMTHHKFDGFQAFEDADTIIFEAGCFDAFRRDFRGAGRLKAYKEARAREIYQRLCQGAAVCMLCGSLPATPVMPTDDRTLQRQRPDYRLLRNLGIVITELNVPLTALKVKRSEFNTFLLRYGTATLSFRRDEGAFQFEICVAENAPDTLTGFATEVEKGLLVCLPCLPRERSENYIKEMLKALAPGLVTFSKRALRQAPGWLAEVHLAPEVPILEQREEASRKVLACDEQLTGYEPFKRILYLSDDELALAVPPVLEAIGFDEAHGFVVEDTSASEGEDFQIRQATGELLVIGEVKHTTRNVKPIHMSKLHDHRTASGLDDDFPALCIANTFLGARTLQEKDTRVESRQCIIAKDMNITVMRTLDLFWLLDEMLLLDRSLRDVQGFLALLRKGGGWLEWTQEGLKLHSS